MKLYDLLHLERHLRNLTYGFEIVDINRDYSYFHEWHDVPYPEIDRVKISGANVYKKVIGSECSWIKIYRIADFLIKYSENPNRRYLAGFEVNGSTLLVGLES
jgi:hypothetical protein